MSLNSPIKTNNNHIKHWPLTIFGLLILLFSFYIFINSYTAQLTSDEDTLFNQAINYLQNINNMLNSVLKLK